MDFVHTSFCSPKSSCFFRCWCSKHWFRIWWQLWQLETLRWSAMKRISWKLGGLSGCENHGALVPETFNCISHVIQRWLETPRKEICRPSGGSIFAFGAGGVWWMWDQLGDNLGFVCIDIYPADLCIDMYVNVYFYTDLDVYIDCATWSLEISKTKWGQIWSIEWRRHYHDRRFRLHKRHFHLACTINPTWICCWSNAHKSVKHLFGRWISEKQLPPPLKETILKRLPSKISGASSPSTGWGVLPFCVSSKKHQNSVCEKA